MERNSSPERGASARNAPVSDTKARVNSEAQPVKQKKVKLNFNADAYKRLNFLHQAAMLTLPSNGDLSRFYMETMKSVAQRNVIRLDPSVKNSMCKQCHTLLVPGLSCSIRFNAARDSHVTVTCQHCHAQTRRRTKHVKQGRKTSTQLEHVTVPLVTRVNEITVPVKSAPVKAEPAPKAPSKKQLRRQRAMQRKDEVRTSAEPLAPASDEPGEPLVPASETDDPGTLPATGDTPPEHVTDTPEPHSNATVSHK